MTPRPPTLTEEDDIRDLRERVARLEWRDAEVEKRLGSGAESFSEIRRQITGKPTQWSRISGVLLAATLAVLAWVWQAARYPDRDEIESIRATIQNQRVDQELLKVECERISELQREMLTKTPQRRSSKRKR